jgi:serine/threonine protein kinase
MLGMDTWDPPPMNLPEIEWERLVHKSGLDRDVEVERVVHDGRASFVAKALHRGRNVPVALKILSPALWEDEVVAERFRREGEILAGLDHPNLVRLVDRGTYGYARWLMITWVEGEDLRTALDRGPLGVDVAVSRVLDLCTALTALHERGLVHRDVKPENMLWDAAAKTVVLTDFGIAKLREKQMGELTLTFTDDVMGTRGYLAPECLSGSRKADHRADVFAAGVVLRELATGERGPEISEQKPKMDAVDPRIDAIVEKATAYEVDHRYASAADMGEELARVRPRGWIRRVLRRR